MLYLSIYLSNYLSIYLSIYLSYLSIYLSIVRTKQSNLAELLIDPNSMHKISNALNDYLCKMFSC